MVPSSKICFSHAKAIKKSSQFLTRRRTFLPRGFRFRKSFFMCTFLEVFLYRQLIMSARGFFTILYPRLLLFVEKDLNFLNSLSFFRSLYESWNCLESLSSSPCGTRLKAASERVKARRRRKLTTSKEGDSTVEAPSSVEVLALPTLLVVV